LAKEVTINALVEKLNEISPRLKDVPVKVIDPQGKAVDPVLIVAWDDPGANQKRTPPDFLYLAYKE
jgi:hypothetical protein